MKEAGTKLRNTDIYSIYTGCRFGKILISVAAATAFMTVVWITNNHALFVFSHIIMFYLVVYIKASPMSEHNIQSFFITDPQKNVGQKFYRGIPKIAKIRHKGYIINHIVTLSAVLISEMSPAAVISALTGNLYLLNKSFNLFSLYTFIITLFTFIRGIRKTEIKILYIIFIVLAGVCEFVFSLMSTDLSQKVMLVTFMLSVILTPFSLYTVTKSIGKEYI